MRSNAASSSFAFLSRRSCRLSAGICFGLVQRVELFLEVGDSLRCLFNALGVAGLLGIVEGLAGHRDFLLEQCALTHFAVDSVERGNLILLRGGHRLGRRLGCRWRNRGSESQTNTGQKRQLKPLERADFDANAREHVDEPGQRVRRYRDGASCGDFQVFPSTLKLNVSRFRRLSRLRIKNTAKRRIFGSEVVGALRPLLQQGDEFSARLSEQLCRQTRPLAIVLDGEQRLRDLRQGHITGLVRADAQLDERLCLDPHAFLRQAKCGGKATDRAVGGLGVDARIDRGLREGLIGGNRELQNFGFVRDVSRGLLDSFREREHLACGNRDAQRGEAAFEAAEHPNHAAAAAGRALKLRIELRDLGFRSHSCFCGLGERGSQLGRHCAA